MVDVIVIVFVIVVTVGWGGDDGSGEKSFSCQTKLQFGLNWVELMLKLGF